MEQKSLRLAVITEYAYRAEAVKQAVVGNGWQQLSIVGQPQPYALLQHQRIGLVLVDLDVPAAIALLGDLARALPNVPLLALATPQHLVELQDAMLAGAMDFVVFPLDYKHFSATIQRVLQDRASRAAGQEKSRVIALANLKGGVGRSTLAANLAVALRQRQAAAVILTEAHHGLSHLSLMLNLYPRHTLASLATETDIDVDVIQGHLQSHGSGVRLLSAPTDLDQLVELSSTTWQRILSLLAALAPYVIVDTAAAADHVLSEVLTRADDILVVMGPDIASLRGALALLETLRGSEDVHGRIHIVLNQADVRGGLDAPTIGKQLGEPIAVSIPHDQPLTTFALNRGVPFVASHPRAMLSRRVHRLVDHLRQDTSTKGDKSPQRHHNPLSSLVHNR
jgi:pilus assembly protein CpaE